MRLDPRLMKVLHALPVAGRACAWTLVEAMADGSIKRLLKIRDRAQERYLAADAELERIT